jgi:hypothetical protein
MCCMSLYLISIAFGQSCLRGLVGPGEPVAEEVMVISQQQRLQHSVMDGRGNVQCTDHGSAESWHSAVISLSAGGLALVVAVAYYLKRHRVEFPWRT